MYLNILDKIKVKYRYFTLSMGGLLKFGRHWSDLKSDAVRRESSSLLSPIFFWAIISVVREADP